MTTAEGPDKTGPAPGPPAEAPPAPTAAPPPPAVSQDDMGDGPTEYARWSGLAPLLQICSEVIEGPYRRADAEALRHQRFHRVCTRGAALAGTAAILFAVLQLAFSNGPALHRFALLEQAAVFLALAAVALGLLAAFQVRWLVERNKAERLRMAKFNFLVGPDQWTGSPDDLAVKRAALVSEVQRISAARSHDVHHWVQNDAVPSPPETVLQPKGVAPFADELLDYYRERRLRYQLAFLQRRAGENLDLDTFTRYLSPTLFFGSVTAVLIHFLYDVFSREEGLDPFSRWLIVLAAALPVLGGAVRTMRSAHEFARNTYRYRAKAVALTSIDAALDHQAGPNARSLSYWFCEQTLENEHREWLRLMLEAEWFA